MKPPSIVTEIKIFASIGVIGLCLLALGYTLSGAFFGVVGVIGLLAWSARGPMA